MNRRMLFAAIACATLDERQREWIFQPSDRAWGGSAAVAEGMVVIGSGAPRMAAPCDTLLSPISPTGIQTKRACDFSGFTASHRAAQCGHCASKKT